MSGLDLRHYGRKVVAVTVRQRLHESLDIALFVGVVFRVRIVAPEADHRADRRHAAALIAAHRGDRRSCHAVLGMFIRVCCDFISKHIIPCIIGIEDLVTLICNKACRCRGVATPAGRPIADDDVLGKFAAACVAVIVNAVVKRDGRHTGRNDLRGDRIDIADKVAILFILDQRCKTVGLVIGILVRAHVEVAAALAGEVIDVLLQERLRERNGSGIRHVDRADRVVGGAVHPRQRGRRAQDCIHVTRRVDQRDDGDVLALRIGNDRVHIRLRELIHAARIVIVHIAVMDLRLHVITGIGLPINRDRHIVQQETQAVVADRQFYVRIVRRGSRVDQRLDLSDAEILSAAIQMENAHEIISCRAARSCLVRCHRER